ncbi:GNAT family N-acetyltransferase [Staphylococcus lloydii]|uniref:GNAT family N-acetyltransferase n=1 Tax=Staphylococcus lloydii TaxID=2781774 RepID=UPI002929282C|nr:GNAT family N-acetyltransferase [Staphylococcus lloydii]MDU9417197.1 GNAT family N-acetyltransferase [Staphylococcus lloydii]
MVHFRILTHSDLMKYQQFITYVLHKGEDVFSCGIYDLELASEENLKPTLAQDNSNCIIIGAFSNEQLIAATTLCNIKIHGLSHKLFLENMAIIADDIEERKQLATQLIAQVFNYCKEQEIEIILASVASNNITAKVFFSDLDFELLTVEQHARKYNQHYVDQHWLVYHLKEIPS